MKTPSRFHLAARHRWVAATGAPRLALFRAIVLGCAVIAVPHRANKVDTLSGLTPGRLIGGAVHVPGGPDIPLAQDHVDQFGSVSFVKPNVGDDFSIEYRDIATGNTFLWLRDFNDSLGTLLKPGVSIPIFTPPGENFVDIEVRIDMDLFGTYLGQLEDKFYFDYGTNKELPGVTIVDSNRFERFSGEVQVVGLNTVSMTPDGGTSWTLLGLGLGALGIVKCASSRRSTPQKDGATRSSR